ncbi:MAG: Trp biosynthesis-associated membrane protein [Rhodoglobus sp.]
MSAKRLRLTLIVGGIVLSGLILLAWTQQWFLVLLAAGQELGVAGDVAAPALSALALAGLVLAGALALAGPVFRVVLGALETAIGALVIVSAVIAVSDPLSAAAETVSGATGVGGDESITALVSAVVVSAWPVATIVLGALLSLLGVTVVVTSKRWPMSSRKYNATRLETVEGNPVDDWDALSDGRDPT